MYYAIQQSPFSITHKPRISNNCGSKWLGLHQLKQICSGDAFWVFKELQTPLKPSNKCQNKYKTRVFGEHIIDLVILSFKDCIRSKNRHKAPLWFPRNWTRVLTSVKFTFDRFLSIYFMDVKWMLVWIKRVHSVVSFFRCISYPSNTWVCFICLY